MKKLLLCLLLTAGTGLLQAQIAFNSHLENETTTGFAAGDKTKKNIVKLNLMALPLKNFSFQYERVITKRLSVALGVRTMPTGSLPFANSFAAQVGDGDPDLEANIRAVKVGNFALTPEVRLYVGRKGYGRGFYIAPYYRYAKFTSDELPVDYDGDGNVTKTIRLKGDMTTHSGGLMFGAQWQIAKMISLDWWILGAHYGKSNGALTGTPSTPLSANEQNDIRTQIEDIDLPLTKITADVNANRVRAIIDGPWGGVRAGLTIGIRF